MGIGGPGWSLDADRLKVKRALSCQQVEVRKACLPGDAQGSPRTLSSLGVSFPCPLRKALLVKCSVCDQEYKNGCSSYSISR